MIFQETKQVLCRLIDGINQLEYDQYTHKGRILFGSTIGGHTRHIIELYQQLLIGYDSGIVDYDKRIRNLKIEESVDEAIEAIALILSRIDRPDKALYMQTNYNQEEKLITSTYFRELVYNVEHCIHHQAIIRIACEDAGDVRMKEDFGVAKSTLENREKCAH